MSLSGGGTPRGFDLDKPVAIVNGENVGAQSRVPQDTDNFGSVVSAQVRKVQSYNVIRYEFVSCNFKMYGG
jgi:hypothetical protein